MYHIYAYSGSQRRAPVCTPFNWPGRPWLRRATRGPRDRPHQDRYARHEVAALRV